MEIRIIYKESEEEIMEGYKEAIEEIIEDCEEENIIFVSSKLDLTILNP